VSAAQPESGHAVTGIAAISGILEMESSTEIIADIEQRRIRGVFGVLGGVHAAIEGIAHVVQHQALPVVEGCAVTFNALCGVIQSGFSTRTKILASCPDYRRNRVGMPLV